MPSYHKDYTEFMEDVITHCAEKARPNDDKGTKIGNGRINYVPHHGVYHLAKPSRVILKYLRYVVKQIFVFCTFRRNAMFVSKCLGMFFGVKLFA